MIRTLWSQQRIYIFMMESPWWRASLSGMGRAQNPCSAVPDILCVNMLVSRARQKYILCVGPHGVSDGIELLQRLHHHTALLDFSELSLDVTFRWNTPFGEIGWRFEKRAVTTRSLSLSANHDSIRARISLRQFASD